MTEEIRTIVSKIDSEIQKQPWFDFCVLHFDGMKLTVAGSTDFTYYHKLEIIFEDVFFFSGFFQGWRSDTSKTTLALPGNEIEMNEKYEIESGHQLFVFKTEDRRNDVIIAAKNLTYNTDTVYYYERPNLGENERLGDFVRKNG